MDRPTVNGLQELLKDDYGLVPKDDWLQVRKLAAIGLTLTAWRNTSSLENIHSDPEATLSDAEMMRSNIATFYLTRGSISETGFDWEGLENQFGDPNRTLVAGKTVGEILGGDFDAVAEDSLAALAACQEIERREGTEFLFLCLAVQGGMMARGWFGSPWWPQIVDEFIDRIRPVFGEAPESLPDPDWLREALLVAPERLGDDEIYWCLSHGLGWDAVERGFKRWLEARD